MIKKILLIGGTGYVGGWLVPELLKKGHKVDFLSRSCNSFMADRLGVGVVSSSGLKSTDEYDAVVNLAYPAEINLNDNFKKTKAIYKLVFEAAKRTPLLIHLSTQAVFGYELTPPFLRSKIKMRFDHSYIESKILMENLILDSNLPCKKRIVRLGNVWGPGSPAWTAKIIKKLFFMETLAVRGKEGFSNVTDVNNISSYISFMIENENFVSSGIDHLAELGKNSWMSFIQPLADELGMKPRLDDYTPPPEISNWMWPLHQLAGSLSPKKMALSLLSDKKTGSLVKRVLELIPSKAIEYLKKGKNGEYRPSFNNNCPDIIFLRIMTGNQLFHTETISGWNPPIDHHQSIQAVIHWMRSAGYKNIHVYE